MHRSLLPFALFTCFVVACSGSGSDDDGPRDADSGDTGADDTGVEDTGAQDTGAQDTGNDDTSTGDTGSDDTSLGDSGSNDTNSDASADTGSGFEGLAGPVCVWNHAYQENTEPDSLSDILAGAEDCYVLVDPFDDEDVAAAIPQIAAAGNTVGCYMSTGTCEDWRDDFDAMRPHCVDEAWGDWEGEYFVDTPNADLRQIMYARLDQMAEWGCDMVEYDNMDWAFDDDYRAEYGFGASAQDAISYHQDLCDYTHSLGMGCMAKNTREGAEGFDGGTFESYPDDLNWWETAHLQGFLDAGQIGVIVHYDESDCDGRFAAYRGTYGDDLSFICEDPSAGGYRH